MTQINFRIDDEVKNNAEQALKEMGSESERNSWKSYSAVLIIRISNKINDY